MNFPQNISPNLMADDSSFSITTMMTGAISWAQDLAGYVVILAGIILIIIGIVQIAKGLAGGGKGQTNRVMSIGALVLGGWTLVANLSKAGKGTLEEFQETGSKSGGTVAFQTQDGLGAVA